VSMSVSTKQSAKARENNFEDFTDRFINIPPNLLLLIK